MADGQPQMQDRYEKDPNIVSRLVGDEFILVPIKQEMADLQSIFTLSGAGVRIWELIDGQRTLSDIRDVIVEEFDVTADVAAADLLEFIEKLEETRSIRRM